MTSTPLYILGGVAYEAVPCQAHGVVLRKAARQKMKEGTTRIKDGRQQVLKNSRWRNVETKGARKAQEAKGGSQQLSLIPEGTLPKVRSKSRIQSPKPPAAVGSAAMGATLRTPTPSPTYMDEASTKAWAKDNLTVPIKDRIKHLAVHEGDELGRNVAAWKIGKVVGGAIAQHAIAMGAPPEASQLIGETIVQAGSATALWATQQARKGTLNARDTAAFFVSQSAAAALGKMAHHGAEEILHSYQAEAMVQNMGALVSGKVTGISTVVGMNKSNLSKKIVDHVIERSRHDINLILTAFTGKNVDLAKSSAVAPGLIELLWELHQAGVALAAMQYQEQGS